jgi:hypothetical protein
MELIMRLSAQKRVGVLIEASVEFLGSNFIVRNNNNFAWKDVCLELNSSAKSGTFIRKAQEIPPKKSCAIGMGEFVDQDGAKFDSLPQAIKSRPQSLAVRCNTKMGNGGFWFGTFV